jgi:hypothetical protein
VLLCLHGWYDFIGRYTFEPATGDLDREWTAFANAERVRAQFPTTRPVPMSHREVGERLRYARSRGFRVALYFADGMNAGTALPGFAPERLLRPGGWVGPDTAGESYCQSPLSPAVRRFFLGYVDALLREHGADLDALVWDETFTVPSGSLGTDGLRGYADRAMLRLVRDVAARVHAYGGRTGREIALLASDDVGMPGMEDAAPYALAADGTYQDSHCNPVAWSYGIFPNYRNVLWSCNWHPVSRWDWTRFGVEAYQAPVAVSNGWGDDTGFAEMSAEERARVLALFRRRARKPTRLRWLARLPEYRPAAPGRRAEVPASQSR